MTIAAKTDVVYAVKYVWMVLGMLHKHIPQTKHDRRNANRLGLQKFLCHCNLLDQIEYKYADTNFNCLMNSGYPSGAPAHHCYIAVIEVVYQALNSPPMYVLYHPPSLTMFHWREGGIICLGNCHWCNLHSGAKGIAKALQQVLTHLFQDPKSPECKYELLPLSANVFFLWKTGTPFLGDPIFVQEGQAILDLPRDQKKEVICVESDDAGDKHGDSGEPNSVISLKSDDTDDKYGDSSDDDSNNSDFSKESDPQVHENRNTSYMISSNNLIHYIEYYLPIQWTCLSHLTSSGSPDGLSWALCTFFFEECGSRQLQPSVVHYCTFLCKWFQEYLDQNNSAQQKHILLIKIPTG